MTLDESFTFLNAIRENPDDDRPRLAYADRLEGDGDGDRAELIRLQCELARHTGEDPRRPGLERRANELRAEYEARWRAGVRAGTSSASFSRGMIVQVTATAAAILRHGADCLRREPIGSVHLEKFRRPQVDDLAYCPHLRHLTDLRFWDSNGRAAVVAVTNSPHLARLRRLSLRCCRLRAADVERLAASPVLARLTALSLRENPGVGDRGVQALAAPAAAGLGTLGLAACGVGDGGAAALAASPHLAGLRELDLSNNEVGDRGFLALASSGRLSGEADLGGNAVTGAGLRAVAASVAPGRLGRLDLSGNAIGAIDSDTVAGLLGRHPELTLDLSRARVPERVLLTLRLDHGDRVSIGLCGYDKTGSVARATAG
jgi:uncharacterized protein (TIGR02996 family)